MGLYQHILLATDFSDVSEQLVNKVQQLVVAYQARLSIIHVIDYLPITDAVYGPIIPLTSDLTDEMMGNAKQHLQKIAHKLAISDNDCWLATGSPKLEIVRVAQEQGVDLIVLGSHGRHGLALLLGSTANGVLHHAPCDVLAVRLDND